jgi:hypothetical protein
MQKRILVLLIIIISSYCAHTQGCVAIRSGGSSCSKMSAETLKSWRLGSSYRYFRSFRHFVGTTEQPQRKEQHTEVINWQHTMNIELTRNINHRWSLGFFLPVLANTRSSLYEHGGNSGGESARHKTHSFGIGDIRIATYRWLLDPVKYHKGNIQAGFGIKLPTGDYKFEDFFVKNSTTKILGPVDQSIQLGDGGTGFTGEINAYYNFSSTLSVYTNLYYLLNPREQNGVSTARGSTPSNTSILYESSTMSVPDQYMIRAGSNYSINRFTISTGIRHECIPSSDLIGGDGGFRRPGYVTSIEPGLSFEFKNASLFMTTPIAVWRNRTQSYPDKLRTRGTGVYAHGDAAFADMALNIGFSYKL